MPDFLINLIKNKPHENLTPTENFLTEVLTYALNNRRKCRGCLYADLVLG